MLEGLFQRCFANLPSSTPIRKMPPPDFLEHETIKDTGRREHPQHSNLELFANVHFCYRVYIPKRYWNAEIWRENTLSPFASRTPNFEGLTQSLCFEGKNQLYLSYSEKFIDWFFDSWNINSKPWGHLETMESRKNGTWKIKVKISMKQVQR